VIIDPATRVARRIPDIELLRRNCETIVMEGPHDAWREWAARQLYALGCAPKLLSAPRRSAWLSSGFNGWVNSNCIIELRFNEVQPPTAEDRAHVFPDGVSYQDVLDAVYAAWLAHKPIIVCEVAERYGLYWHATLPSTYLRGGT
jgi:hypothetical protein